MKKMTILAAAALALLCGCSLRENEEITMNAAAKTSEKNGTSFCECISCLQNRYLYCTSLGFSNAFVTIEPGDNVYYDTESGVFVGDFYLCVHDKNGKIIGDTALLISGNPAQRFTLKSDEVSGMVTQYAASDSTVAEFKMDGFSAFYRLSHDKGAEIFRTPDAAYFFCENDSFSVEESAAGLVLVGEKARITFDTEKLTAQ